MAKNGGNSGASPQGSQGLQVRKNSFGARAIRDFKKNYEKIEEPSELSAKSGNVLREGGVGNEK